MINKFNEEGNFKESILVFYFFSLTSNLSYIFSAFYYYWRGMFSRHFPKCLCFEAALKITLQMLLVFAVPKNREFMCLTLYWFLSLILLLLLIFDHICACGLS